MPARREFSLSVYDYAMQWREARASKSCDKILRPPGATCMLSGHTNNRFTEPQNQDRIYLTYRSAWQHRRSTGYVANIRFESSGLNAAKPASAQIVLKLMWEDSAGETRFVYARTTAYASAYSPRLISPCSFAHIALGDIISGVLELPHSKQCSTNMVCWDCPDVATLLRIHGRQVPEACDIILEPGIVGDIPQLGGINFWQCPTLSSLVSLRLELPPVDVNAFKETASKPKGLPPPSHPPPRMKDRNLSMPFTIPEESTDLPVLEEEGKAPTDHTAGSSNDPPDENVTKYQAMVSKLQETVSDQGAFPADRQKAAQYLEEFGLQPQISIPIPDAQTPKRLVCINYLF